MHVSECGCDNYWWTQFLKNLPPKPCFNHNFKTIWWMTTRRLPLDRWECVDVFWRMGAGVAIKTHFVPFVWISTITTKRHFNILWYLRKVPYLTQHTASDMCTTVYGPYSTVVDDAGDVSHFNEHNRCLPTCTQHQHHQAQPAYSCHVMVAANCRAFTRQISPNAVHTYQMNISHAHRPHVVQHNFHIYAVHQCRGLPRIHTENSRKSVHHTASAYSTYIHSRIFMPCRSCRAHIPGKHAYSSNISIFSAYTHLSSCIPRIHANSCTISLPRDRRASVAFRTSVYCYFQTNTLNFSWKPPWIRSLYSKHHFLNVIS